MDYPKDGKGRELSANGTVDGSLSLRDPRWDYTLERHKQLLRPYNADKAAERLQRYPDEESRFDPHYIAGYDAAEEALARLFASHEKFVIVTSPKAKAQLASFDGGLGGGISHRAIEVAGVHAGFLDGRFGQSYFDQAAAIEPNPEKIVAIGLGSVSDWAKLIGHKFSADVVILPSALSTNAPFTGNIVIRDQDENGLAHYSYTPHAALEVIVDLGLIALNPRGNAAGIGDLLSSHVALRDWDLAIAHGADRADPAVRADTVTLLQRLSASALEVIEGTEEGLLLLAELNSGCSKLMTRFRSGRPKAGSEHVLAESLERVTVGRKILHGEMVGVTNLLMTCLYCRREGDRHGWQALRAISEALGVCLELARSGLTRDDLVAALTVTRPKTNRFSYFDVYTVEESEAREVVETVFP